MAPRNRYPLEPVVRHRQHQVDERARELAESNQQAALAAQRRAVAEQRVHDHEQHTRQIESTESERVTDGDANVADLALLGAWSLARAEQAKALDQAAAQAQRGEQTAATQRAAAAHTLSSAHADARVIERHRDAHVARQQAREQAAIEEEAGEVHASRASRRAR